MKKSFKTIMAVAALTFSVSAVAQVNCDQTINPSEAQLGICIYEGDEQDAYCDPYFQTEAPKNCLALWDFL